MSDLVCALFDGHVAWCDVLQGKHHGEMIYREERREKGKKEKKRMKGKGRECEEEKSEGKNERS